MLMIVTVPKDIDRYKEIAESFSNSSYASVSEFSYVASQWNNHGKTVGVLSVDDFIINQEKVMSEYYIGYANIEDNLDIIRQEYIDRKLHLDTLIKQLELLEKYREDTHKETQLKLKQTFYAYLLGAVALLMLFIREALS